MPTFTKGSNPNMCPGLRPAPNHKQAPASAAARVAEMMAMAGKRPPSLGPQHLARSAMGAMAAGLPKDYRCRQCGHTEHILIPNCSKCRSPRPPELKAAADRVAPMAKTPAAGSAVSAPGTATNPAPPGQTEPGRVENLRPGDWLCPQCKDHQYARNVMCRRCKTPRPKDVPAPPPIPLSPMPGTPGAEMMRPGDWICGQCGDHQYARNAQCRRCGNSRPNSFAVGIPAAQQAATAFQALAQAGTGTPASAARIQQAIAKVQVDQTKENPTSAQGPIRPAEPPRAAAQPPTEQLKADEGGTARATASPKKRERSRDRRSKSP
eukprot:Hpha_TRINITY_DN27330_c0_g1::TRINITY_DN27330_c0_g1_i1::g.575::m.575